MRQFDYTALSDEDKKLHDAAGCLRLWREVILQAVRDIVLPKKQNSIGKELVKSRAVRWIKSESQGIGSFLWACEATGISAEKLRDEIVVKERYKLSDIYADL